MCPQPLDIALRSKLELSISFCETELKLTMKTIDKDVLSNFFLRNLQTFIKEMFFYLRFSLGSLLIIFGSSCQLSRVRRFRIILYNKTAGLLMHGTNNTR